MVEISIKVVAKSPIAVSAKKKKHQALANLSEVQQEMIFKLVNKPGLIDKLIDNESLLMSFV